ncbi:MAG: protein kinase [Kiritimatiellales bacterium]|nr:protein kinase [Kiritimatiellales bacterium]
MDPLYAKPKCTECGGPLAEGVPSGLCLRCLLALGLKSERDGGEEFMDQPPAPAGADSFDRYRVIEKIGEGGCGVVYRAEQLAPVRREVALKVIKLGMDTQAVLARFQAERQALALMDHPHIAQVLDAGASQSGRPFFAMELVRGEPITTYCDRRELSVRQRLELFTQVCHALEHAHQKGVIHRDIKPSNILVMEQDGVPVPKVIDFGVAKATSTQRLADQTVYTAFDQFVGTPAYMSPEQAGLTSEDIDTRSDIYSLGVLLYELLTGRPPFDPGRMRQVAINEICRIIREEDPAPPSSRVATLNDKELSETARCRLSPAPRLAAQLRGDLDWLVMKAMEKERNRRYASAGDLAADIGRYLGHEPISAGPPAALYLLRKFARRNRSAVIAVTSVVLALLAGLILSSWLYIREKETRHWAEARAYASDMGLAARLVSQPLGLGGVARLLSAWPDREPDQRGWEWYYLNGLCHQEVLAIDAASNALSSVDWSPDGTRLASGGAGNEVRIWDATTGSLVATLSGHTDTVNAVAWNPDGQRLASGGSDGSARIWDVTQSKQLHVLRCPGNQIFSMAWSPDGRALAVGCRDGQVKLWDAGSGTELKTLRGQRAAQCMAWSHDGSRLAGVGGDELLMLWDVSTGKDISFNSLPGYGGFRTVVWSPDDRMLATGGDDFTIKLFDSATGTNTATFWGHHGGIGSLAWNTDGTRLASADRGDGTVRIWDVAGQRMVRSFRGHRGPATSVEWQPHGTRVASAGSDGTIRIWDANRDNQSLRSIRHPNQVLSISWHPDGRRLAVGGRDDSAAIWDMRQMAKPIELHSPVNWVWKVAWNPAGSLLATLGDDNIVRLWHSDGRDAGQFATGDGIRAMAWNPDGTRLALVGGKLNIWTVATTNATVISDLDHAGSLAVAWSPDGERLAASAGHRILVLDARSGRPLRTLTGHSDAVRALAWSPDSLRLASASDDALAKVWNMGTGHDMLTLAGHTAPVWTVAWSPDGTRLVTGGWDNVVKVWDPANGIELCSLTDHPAQVASVAFSPDGDRLASSDLDGNIFIRDAGPGRQGIQGMSSRRPSSNALQPLIWRRDILEKRAIAGDLDSMYMLSTLLATCPYAELRDGRKAVEFGKKAVEITHRNNAGVLDGLAAAYAEAGDFTNAVATQKEAIALLNGPIAKAEFTTRLRLYESGTPCRNYDL